MPELYLASKSPRRLSILKSMGLEDIVVLTVGEARLTAYEGDEERLEGETPADYVARVALGKAKAIFDRIVREKLPRAPVLAADTAVILGDAILGKPRDATEEKAFLRALSGKTHEVRTVAVLLDDGRIETRVSVNRVHFKELSESEIERYAASEEPYDKAGGYAIQGLAALFIDKIEGSYSGIMGLPVFETAELLKPYRLPKPFF